MQEHMDAQSKDQDSGPIEPPGFEVVGNTVEDRRSDQIPKSGPFMGDKRTRGSNCSKIPQSKNGTGSEDTCEKLAKEALHIGQILGIKVVRNEKAAVAKLAESMKKQKSKKVNRSIPTNIKPSQRKN